MDAKILIAVALGLAPLGLRAEEASTKPDPAVAPAVHHGKPTAARSLQKSKRAAADSPLRPAEKPPVLLPTPPAKEIESANETATVTEAATPAVGRPLPMLPEPADEAGGPEPAAFHDHIDPPAPQGLAIPPWLLPPAGHNARTSVAAAFDVEGVSPRRPQADQPRVGAVDGVVFVTDQSAVDNDNETPDPQMAALLASAEKLADGARSIGDLTDLIEQCGADAEGFPHDAAERALAPVAAWAFNRRGELHAEAGDDRTAFDDFQRAVLIDPNLAEAFHNRGVTLAQYGRREAALGDFSTALRIDPGFAACLGNRGELFLELGRYKNAEADFTQAIAAAADNGGYYAGRAAARRRLGHAADAVRDLNEAIRLRPGDAAAYAERGALYAEAGLYEQAVAEFDAALRIDPYSVAAYQGLAWLLSTCGDPEFRDTAKALESARRALRLGNAEDAALLDSVAAAHAAAGHTDDAVRYVQQAMLLAPEDQHADLAARLERYRLGRPYRQPSRGGER